MSSTLVRQIQAFGGEANPLADYTNNITADLHRQPAFLYSDQLMQVTLHLHPKRSQA